MNVYLANLLNKLKSSFWLLPAVMTVAAFILSFITLNMDRAIDDYQIPFFSLWQGGTEGARGLLATIAGSIITITGVVFSITTVALALTSNQYGSSLLPSFMRDIGTQLVLGTFISTSIYSLLILRTVRGDGSTDAYHAFTPNLSITISLVLAILSLSLLIYFIHHLSVRIQSTNIIARVSQDLIAMIEKLTEDQNAKVDSKRIPLDKKATEILADQLGYLQAIDYDKLLAIAKANQFIINIDIRPGRFVRKKLLLAKVYRENLPEDEVKLISNAFIIGKERVPVQDLEYGIDQLVNIALRSLGSSQNDPFTANMCIDHLGAALCLICQKNLHPIPEAGDFIQFSSKQETFSGLLDASFNQIRQYGSLNPSILIHLLETFASILECSQNSEQRHALKKHALMIKELGDQLAEKDQIDLNERFHVLNAKLEKLNIGL